MSELGKLAAARDAVDREVQSGQTLGIGSGSTIVYAVKRIGERIQVRVLSHRVHFVAHTSFQRFD